MASSSGYSFAPGTRVLVVEDTQINQMILQALLAQQGIDVVVANDGVEALASLSNATVMPDVILCDVLMPNMDGYEATRQIRAGKAGTAAATLPIIAMTANTSDQDRQLCLDAGMTDFTTKPIIPEEIFAAIERALKPASPPLDQPA